LKTLLRIILTPMMFCSVFFAYTIVAILKCILACILYIKGEMSWDSTMSDLEERLKTEDFHE
jgi:hypothetical protein